jgi:hypothetical protein
MFLAATKTKRLKYRKNLGTGVLFWLYELGDCGLLNGGNLFALSISSTLLA